MVWEWRGCTKTAYAVVVGLGRQKAPQTMLQSVEKAVAKKQPLLMLSNRSAKITNSNVVTSAPLTGHTCDGSCCLSNVHHVDALHRPKHADRPYHI